MACCLMSLRFVRCLSLILCVVNSLRSEFPSTEKVNCEAFSLHLIDCECHKSTTTPGGIQVFCNNNRNVTSIPEKIDGLATLKITGADIRLIDGAIDYPGLIGLYLNEDQIRFIDDFSFANLGQLVDLSLANNQLSSITGNTFAGLSSLELLVLTGNRLYVVRADSFSGSNLPSLQILKMDRCSLYDIEPDSFPALSHLAILNIAYNRLQQLPPAVGGKYGLSNLTHLNLSDNRLSDVDGSFFAKVPSLTHLYLDRNNLQHVPIGSLKESLIFLSLRKNRIESLSQSPGLEASLPRLRILDLSFNSLTKLNFAELRSGDLEKILIHDNPWDCDECDNEWMFDESIVFRWNSEANVSCATPSEFSGLNVYRNRNKVFASCSAAKSSIAVPVLIGMAVLLVLLTLCMVVVFKLRVKHRRQKLVNKEELDSLASSKEKLSESTLFAMPRYHKEREDEQSFL